MQAGSLRIEVRPEDRQRLNERVRASGRTPRAEVEWLLHWALEQKERWEAAEASAEVELAAGLRDNARLGEDLEAEEVRSA